MYEFQFALYFISSSIYALKSSAVSNARNFYELFNTVQRAMTFTGNNFCSC
jgi:hypothetical protein